MFRASITAHFTSPQNSWGDTSIRSQLGNRLVDGLALVRHIFIDFFFRSVEIIQTELNLNIVTIQSWYHVVS